MWGLETELKISVLGSPISNHPSILTLSPVSCCTLNILVTGLELGRSMARILALPVVTHTFCSKTRANRLSTAGSLSHNCQKRPTDWACVVIKSHLPPSPTQLSRGEKCQQWWFLHDACMYLRVQAGPKKTRCCQRVPRPSKALPAMRQWESATHHCYLCPDRFGNPTGPGENIDRSSKQKVIGATFKSSLGQLKWIKFRLP